MAKGVELASAYVSLSVSTDAIPEQIRKAFNAADSQSRKSGIAHGKQYSSSFAAAMGAGMTRGGPTRWFADFKADAVKSGNVAGYAAGRAMGASITAGLTAATAGLAAVASGIGFTLFKGFERYKSLDATAKRLQAMGKTGEQVKSIIGDINSVVEGTPIALDAAAGAATQFLGAGVKEGKELKETLTAIADAAGFSGTNFQDLSIIFGQVMNKGKLQAEEMLQLNERNIPIQKWLQDELGVTGEALTKMSKDGQISFKNLVDAVESGAGGMAKKMGDTIDGAIGQMQTAVARVGANFLAAIFGDPMSTTDGPGGMAQAINQVTAKLNQLNAWVVAHQGEIKQFFTDAADTAKTLAGAVKDVGLFLKEHPGLVQTAIGAYVGFKALTIGSGALAAVNTMLGKTLPASAAAGAAGINSALAAIVIPPALSALLGSEIANKVDDLLPGGGDRPDRSPGWTIGAGLTAPKRIWEMLTGQRDPNTGELRPPRQIGTPGAPGVPFTPGQSTPPGSHAPRQNPLDVASGGASGRSSGGAPTLDDFLGSVSGGGQGAGLNLALSAQQQPPGIDAISAAAQQQRELGSTSEDTGGALLPLTEALKARYSSFGFGNIGGYRQPDGFNEHSAGKALDVMVPNWQSEQGIAMGNAVTMDALRMPGVEYVIWRNQMWYPDGTRKPYSGYGSNPTPTQAHMDHPHIKTFDEGGWLPPGMTLADNQTGKPELILTPEQVQNLASQGVDPNTAMHGQGQGRPPGLTPQDMQNLALGAQAAGGGVEEQFGFGSQPGDNPLAALAGGTEGFIPSGAGSTSVAGTSFVAGLLNLGNEAVAGLIDMGAQLAKMGVSAAVAGGTMGAGAAAGPAASAAAGIGIDIAAGIAKRGVSYGFQMASIGADALIEQLFPIGGPPRWLGYDYTQLAPQLNIQGSMAAAGEALGSALFGQQGQQGQPMTPVDPLTAQHGTGMGQPPGPGSASQAAAQPIPPPPTNPFGAETAAPPQAGTPGATPQPTTPPIDPTDPTTWGVFDTGGVLAPNQGAVNLSSRPEYVFTQSQFRAMETNASQNASGDSRGPVTYNVYGQDISEQMRELRKHERRQAGPLMRSKAGL